MLMLVGPRPHTEVKKGETEGHRFITMGQILVDKQKKQSDKMSKILVFVNQNCCDDATWKPPIPLGISPIFVSVQEV